MSLLDQVVGTDYHDEDRDHETKQYPPTDVVDTRCAIVLVVGCGFCEIVQCEIHALGRQTSSLPR